MSPARCIDLPGRDGHRSQGSHQQRRLLTTAAISRADGGQRTAGAGIAGTIGDMLVTPVVHLEDGLLHRHALQPGLQLAEEDRAAGVERLIVHADGHYEMPELALWHLAAPRHLSTCLQGQFHLPVIVLTRIVGFVGQRHVLIEEVHVGLLLPCVTMAGHAQQHGSHRQQYSLHIQLLGLAVAVDVAKGSAGIVEYLAWLEEALQLDLGIRR